MAYNEKLADRIREHLSHKRNIKEKEMMGGLCFMLNEKMCVGIFKDELMCRIDPVVKSEALEKTGCREMTMGGRTMKGYVLVDDTGMKSPKQMDYWIGLCIDFNKRAKASKKRLNKK